MPSRMAASKEPSSPLSDSSSSNPTRIQRNLAEKQRRDKLNGYISELATIVPMVSMASKRLDKTSILRLSAAHLRISQNFHGDTKKKVKNSFKWRPSFFSSDQIREILESVEGFLLVTSTNGKIIYISQSVEKFLGHQNIEMIGHSIFSFVHPSDADTVRSQLQTLCLATGLKEGSSSFSARCSFYCRLRERNQPRSEVLTYQFVHVVGHMTGVLNEDDDETMEMHNSSKGSTSTSNLILKAFVRVVHSNPYNELSLSDAIEDEYVTRHSPDGTIVFADHRLATITGHLPHEVYSMSAYEYINGKDIPIALFAHKLMFSNNGGTGVIVYRLRTKNEKFVYLRSTGYLQFEKSSSQVDHFVCVNKHLSDEDGEEELKNFIERFTPHISDTPSLLESIKSIQGCPVVKVESKKSDDDDDDTMALMDVDASTSKPSSIKENHVSDVKKVNNRMNGYHTIVRCSKKMSEKLSLVSEVNGRSSVNYSPLTESSFSANSPPSDVISPKTVCLGQLDTQFTVNEASSSSELMAGGDMTAQELEDLVGQDQLLCSSNGVCSSPFLNASSQSSSDQVTVFLQSNSIPSPESPILMNEDVSFMDHSFWNGSPSINGLGYPDESPLPTPPPSGEESNSKNGTIEEVTGALW